MDSDRGTIANAVMKRLKSIIVGITIATHAGALLNIRLDGSRPIEITEIQEAIEEHGTGIDREEERTIRQPHAASSSTPQTMVTSLRQKAKLTALAQNQPTDSENVKQRQNRGESIDLISDLRTAKISPGSDDVEVKRPSRRRKKKAKSKKYDKSSFYGSVSEGLNEKLSKCRVRA